MKLECFFSIITNLNENKNSRHNNCCMEEMTLLGFVLEPWGKVGSLANTAADMIFFKHFYKLGYSNQIVTLKRVCYALTKFTTKKRKQCNKS